MLDGDPAAPVEGAQFAHAVSAIFLLPVWASFIAGFLAARSVMLRDRCPVCVRPSVCNVGYCGQTVGWIRLPLGMEVGLSPGGILLDGDPAPPPRKGGQPHNTPLFGPLCSGTVANLSN